ncbi:Uncharacterised protein [uncultured archaeon]|nr:Uncharacterised protein [uncultured archaeon]
MTENTQNGVISDLTEILRLLLILASRKINLQHILYLIAFLTFGLGDAITGALMMHERGAAIEANPFIGYLFTTQGFDGVITGKVWLTLLILFATYIIQLKSPDMHWTVNGFLISLTIGGLMAVNANLTALAGGIPQAPGAIIVVYLVLMFILIEIGSFVDGHSTRVKID